VPTDCTAGHDHHDESRVKDDFAGVSGETVNELGVGGKRNLPLVSRREA